MPADPLTLHSFGWYCDFYGDAAAYHGLTAPELNRMRRGALATEIATNAAARMVVTAGELTLPEGEATTVIDGLGTTTADIAVPGMGMAHQQRFGLYRHAAQLREFVRLETAA